MKTSVVFVLWFASVLLPACTARAKLLPTLTIRYMTVEADAIVIGEPVDAPKGDAAKRDALPSTFKVVKVLGGSDKLLGEKLSLDGADLYRLSRDGFPREDEPPLPQIAQAVLFLQKPTDPKAGGKYRIVLSGVRAMSEEKEFLVPQQFMNPGPLHLTPHPKAEWEAMLKQIEQDLPTIASLRALGEIGDRAKRNDAIFAWIEKHREDFKDGGTFGKEARGWGKLEHQLFDWIMESRIPGDCWRALELGKELETGPVWTRAPFGSAAGRELLMARLLDEKASDASRLMALRQLRDGGNYWSADPQRKPGTSIVSPEQQQRIIEKIVPFLKHEDRVWRREAADCLGAVSSPYDAVYKERTSKLAVPHLEDLYRKDPDAGVRQRAAEALRRIEDEKYWKKLSGNPDGIVVTVRHAAAADEVLEFHLNLDHTRAVVTEVPRFKFEQLDKDGQPAETVLIEPTVKYPKDTFEKGWNPWQGMIVLTAPRSKLKPGSWRLTVEGRIGEEKWRSEAIDVKVSETK